MCAKEGGRYRPELVDLNLQPGRPHEKGLRLIGGLCITT
jgi:hypothetical protein